MGVDDLLRDWAFEESGFFGPYSEVHAAASIPKRKAGRHLECRTEDERLQSYRAQDGDGVVPSGMICSMRLGRLEPLL